MVVGASAILAVTLGTPASEEIKERLRYGGQSFHRPHLLDIEVSNLLRRYWLLGEIETERAREAVADLSAMPVRRHSHYPLLPRIWGLRRNLTAYDAA